MLSHADFQRAIGGRFFRVVFTKRTDGTRRTMRARLGVRKHVSGAGPKYSFADRGLLSVWDVDKRSYRCIPLDAVLEVQCGPVVLTHDGLLVRSPVAIGDDALLTETEIVGGARGAAL